jgi:hypothetical protein
MLQAPPVGFKTSEGNQPLFPKDNKADRLSTAPIARVSDTRYREATMKRLACILTPAVWLCAAASAQAPASISGEWNARIASSVDFIFRFTVAPDGRVQGTLEIPVSGAENVSLDSVTVIGQDVQFRFGGQLLEFQGKFEPGGEAIAGSLTRDGHPAPIRLTLVTRTPAPRVARKPVPREVVDWFRSAAIPLKTTEPGHGFEDLRPFRELIGDARIVSMGEATHGTREFFQLKHRLLEFLVTEMGFARDSVPGVPEFDFVSAEQRRQIGAAAEELVRSFDAKRAQYEARSSEAEWKFARQNAVIVQQVAKANELGARDRFMAENVASDPRPGLATSAHKVGLGEVDDFGAAAIENSFDHEQAEALDLIDGNGWRHREFLPAHHGFNQGRPLMAERLPDHGFNLIRRFGAKPKNARGLGHLREIRVMQAGSKIEDAGRLHFQFDKGQRAVVKDDGLDRQLQLAKREQIAHEHGETTVSRHRDHLTAGMTDLRSNRLRERIGHGAVHERAEQSALAIHVEIARGPDGWRTHVAGEDGIFSGKLIQHSGDVLGMDWFLSGFASSQIVQAFAGLAIVLQGSA